MRFALVDSVDPEQEATLYFDGRVEVLSDGRHQVHLKMFTRSVEIPGKERYTGWMRGPEFFDAGRYPSVEFDSLPYWPEVVDKGGSIQGVELAVNVPLSLLTPVLDGFGVSVNHSDTRSAIVDALHRVVSGEIYMPDAIDEAPQESAEEADILTRIGSLTPQQRIVLTHLVHGRLNKQIAHDLSVSMTTVKAHVSAILQKLNVFSRTQAVILANLVHFDGDN